MFEDEKKVKLEENKLRNNSEININYNHKLDNFQKIAKSGSNIDGKKNNISEIKKKNKNLIIIVLVFLIVLAASGYFYYYKGEAMLLSYQMEWNWGTKTDSFYTENNLFLELNSIDIKNQSDSLGMLGTLPKNLKLNSNINLKKIGENAEGLLDLNLDLGSNLNFNIDFKFIDKKIYLKPRITGLHEIIPFLNLSDIDSQDQWIIIDSSEGNLPIPLNQKETDSLFEDIQSKIPMFLEALKDKGIYSIKDPHQIKEIEGHKLKRIDYFIKQDKIDDFIFLAIDVYTKNEDEAYKAKEEFIKNKQDKPQEWESVKELINNLKVFLWIDKDSNLIKGFNLVIDNFKIDTEDIGAIINLDYGNLITDIEPSDILEPDDSISIEDFLQQFQEKLYADQLLEVNNDNQETDNNQDTDGDGIADYIEEMIGTDINNQDTDGDGYLDLEEIENGYSPLGTEELNAEMLDLYNQIMNEESDISTPVNNLLDS